MKKFCTHCGKELENLESLNFCSFCGGNLKNQKEKNTEVDKISHSKEFKSSNTNYNFKHFEYFEDKYKEKEKEKRIWAFSSLFPKTHHQNGMIFHPI